MANQKKRIALTVPDDMDAILDRLSDLTKLPKTKLIMEMLEEYLPVLDRTVKALEQIHEDKANAPLIAKQFASELILESNEKLGFIAAEAKIYISKISKAPVIAVTRALNQFVRPST